MKGLIKVITLAVSLLIVSQAFAWDDMCKLGRDALSLTTVQLGEYYKDNIKGKLVEGRGIVRNVWQHGVNREYAVKIDCGNDVIVNVSTSSDVKDLKVSQQVSFDGTCISYSRRLYVDTKQPYMHFELERGSVK